MKRRNVFPGKEGKKEEGRKMQEKGTKNEEKEKNKVQKVTRKKKR